MLSQTGQPWVNVKLTDVLLARVFLTVPWCFVNYVINAIQILQVKLRNMIVLYIDNEG
jgi:hypothetical protein